MVPAPVADVTSPPSLRGFTVAVAAERGAQEQVEMLAALGAQVVHGPVLAPVPLARREALEAAVDELVLLPPAAVVFASPAATRSWFDIGESVAGEQVLAAIVDAATVVVGAEARGAVAAETAIDALAAAASGARVAVPLDSGPAESLADALAGAGFDVVAVPWCPSAPPEDPTAARLLVQAVVDGRVDAVTLSAAGEVRNLVAIAADAGLDAALVAALSTHVVPACQGGGAASAAMEAGMTGLVQPQVARPGAMLDALAARLCESVLHLHLGGVDVELRGLLAVVADDEVWLSERERSVLSQLARRPGAVVTKAELLRRVWRSDGVDGADGHAVEVAVARLRRRLGPAGPGLVTVPRRGYRLAPG